MTYPPQPGPYGPQPPGPYGQQPPPDPYAQQQSSYQGLGTYAGDPGGPPPRRTSTAKIVAVVVIALLVLGGGGAGAYYLIKHKNEDKTTGATDNKQENTPRPNESNGSGPINDDKPPQQPTGGSSDPAGVQQAYIEAYESKRFDDVLNGACDAYKKKFGTNTKDLETQLTPYDIKATADGKPEVTGGTATAKINLELTKDGETKTPKIKIKIVKESGKWKFCGEGEA